MLPQSRGNRQPATAAGPGSALRVFQGGSGSTDLPLEPVARSSEFVKLIRQTIRIARSRAAVIICGESGTGKELFARLIHEHSPRHDREFARVNCASLSESLMESELFGHEKGAFTGAVESRSGWFEFADRGTLLLDEVSEIPLTLQAKLLRVLEEGEFQRVGSHLTRSCDVRIVATSNLDLAEQVARKKFRLDLYHRLNMVPIRLPALRERTQDIPHLAEYFLHQFKHEAEVEITGFSDAAMQRLCRYDWPGNVRQLRNAIHHACIMTDASELQPEHFPDFEQPTSKISPSLFDLSLEQAEKLLILENLKRFNGNRTKVATQLGITTRTLTSKLKIYRERGWVEPDWKSL